MTRTPPRRFSIAVCIAETPFVDFMSAFVYISYFHYSIAVRMTMTKKPHRQPRRRSRFSLAGRHRGDHYHDGHLLTAPRSSSPAHPRDQHGPPVDIARPRGHLARPTPRPCLHALGNALAPLTNPPCTEEVPELEQKGAAVRRRCHRTAVGYAGFTGGDRPLAFAGLSTASLAFGYAPSSRSRCCSQLQEPEQGIRR